MRYREPTCEEEVGLPQYANLRRAIRWEGLQTSSNREVVPDAFRLLQQGIQRVSHFDK